MGKAISHTVFRGEILFLLSNYKGFLDIDYLRKCLLIFLKIIKTYKPLDKYRHVYRITDFLQSKLNKFWRLHILIVEIEGNVKYINIFMF